MVNIELYVAIMAGVVLSFFMIVSEIAVMRKQVVGIWMRLLHLYQSGKILRFCIELFMIILFILVQPMIIALMVIAAMDRLNPNFSGHVIQQLRQLAALYF